MDLAQGVRVLLRRWFIVLIGLGLTAGAAFYVYDQSPRAYATSARLLILLPPGASGAEQPNSPFIYLPNGLNILAQLLSTEAATHRFQLGLVEDGHTATFAVGVDARDPILTISSEDADPEMVLETRDAVIRRLEAELNRVQDEESVPDPQRAHMRASGVDDMAQAMGGNRLQAAAGAVAAGGLVTLLLTFLIDRWAQNRAAKKAGATRGSTKMAGATRDSTKTNPSPNRTASRRGSMNHRAAAAKRSKSSVDAAQA